MHVPKTGGSALAGVLGNRFASGEILELYTDADADLSDPDAFRYVSGHVTLAFADRFRRAPFVLTVLRDPIDRALSSYSFVRSSPPTYEPPADGGFGVRDIDREWWRVARQFPLEEAISRAPGLAREFLGNRQARARSGSKTRSRGSSAATSSA